MNTTGITGYRHAPRRLVAAGLAVLTTAVGMAPASALERRPRTPAASGAVDRAVDAALEEAEDIAPVAFEPMSLPGAIAPGPEDPMQVNTPSAHLLQDDAYILGPGDSLSLRFLSADELSGTLAILNDGTVTLPLLGSVRMTGLTLSQATLWLQQLYGGQLQRPDLILSVAKPRPLRIAVVGEVQTPGLYTLTTSEASQTDASVSITGLPTLVDAIQKSGGITTMANLTNVMLQRRLPGERPQFKRTRLDLLALVRDGDQLQNPLLFDGDTVRVERVTRPVASTVNQLAATTLAPTAITVNIVGEVKSPGRLSVPANTPMMQAILAAGDVSRWRANKADVELVRINRNGSAFRETFQIDYNQGVANNANPPLVDGDTVIVNRSWYAVSTDALGAVVTPISGLVNILTLFRLLDD